MKRLLGIILVLCPLGLVGQNPDQEIRAGGGTVSHRDKRIINNMVRRTYTLPDSLVVGNLRADTVWVDYLSYHAPMLVLGFEDSTRVIALDQNVWEYTCGSWVVQEVFLFTLDDSIQVEVAGDYLIDFVVNGEANNGDEMQAAVFSEGTRITPYTSVSAHKNSQPISLVLNAYVPDLEVGQWMCTKIRNVGTEADITLFSGSMIVQYVTAPHAPH